MGWLVFAVLGFFAVRYFWNAAMTRAPKSRQPVARQSIAGPLAFEMLVNGRPVSPRAPGSPPDDGDRLQVIDIPGVGFFVSHAKSSSGRYLLGLRDSEGGGRSKGWVALMYDRKPIWKATLQRPMEGAVADDGTCAVADVQNNKLRSRLYVFARDGSKLVDHAVRANAWNCGISPDGSVAVFQVCNSDNDDGSGLFILDTRAAKLLARTYPVHGWADGYRFDIDRSLVTLTYKGGQESRITFDGICLDAPPPAPPKIRKARAKKAKEPTA